MVLPPIEEIKFTEGFPKLKICVTGAGGFIASHLARRLKAEGHSVRGVDWKENEHMTPEMFCDEFMLLDLRFPDNCAKAVEGMDWCFNLAVRARRRVAQHQSSTLQPAVSLHGRRPSSDSHRPWGRVLLRCLALGSHATAARIAHNRRPTWEAWGSSSPTTRASCTTQP